MTTIISPSLDETAHTKHRHLGFAGIYTVFADRFRVRRERVRIQISGIEYAKLSGPRTLGKLSNRLKAEFGGDIEIGKYRSISTDGTTRWYIVAEAHPFAP